MPAMLTGNSASVAEDDPLPPEDRALSASDVDVDGVYRRERSGLLGFLRRRTSVEHATDLVQHVFLRFVGLDAQQRVAIKSPAAYLRQSAANASSNSARSARRRLSDDHVSADDVDLHGPDQVAALEARDTLRRIEAALLKLKPRTREIFLAHRIDGYSYVEIAGRTGLSVKGVEKHMSRAIAHIDRFLDV